jgi:Lon protease-like protein
MTTLPQPLPLFPLRTVLFPGGLLALKVFEARYLDLMSRCMRSGEPFGMVCITEGSEMERGGDSASTRIEDIGVLARIDEVDAEQPGILMVRCTGTSRFRLLEAPSQQPGGLWSAHAEVLVDDPVVAPVAAMAAAVDALRQAAATLAAEGHQALVEPLSWDDAGWVANRWCELLPLPLSAKQRLMVLDEPTLRLKLIDEFLRNRKVI